MANIKYLGEFRSLHGFFYRIEIWDEEYTGVDITPFNVTGNGFELNYSGQTDNIYSPIIGSAATFGMYIENDEHEDFVESLKLYQENRYYIKIRKFALTKPVDVSENFRFRVEADGGTYEAGSCLDDALAELGVGSETLTNEWVDFHRDRVEADGGIFEGENCTINAINALGGTKSVPFENYSFKWGGYITQDVMQIEDASTPYVLSITATDGINKLKNSDAGTGFTPLSNVFTNAVFFSYTWNIFLENDPILKMISNWWSQQHTYDAEENPLQTTVIDLDAFHNYDSDGTIQKTSYYDVLTNICRAFGIRFYFADGSFRAEQIFQRDNDRIREFAYKRNGNLIGNELITRDKTINQTSNAARLAGNIYNFLPAVNKTTIRTEEGDVNYGGVISNETTQPTIDLGFTTDTPQNWLEVSFNYDVELEVNTNVNNFKIYYVLDLDISIDDGTTTYYLKRDHNGINPNNAVWTTTQAGSGYQVLIGPFIESVPDPPYSEFHRGSMTIVTPTLPQEGDIEVQFNSNKWVNSAGVTRTLNAANDSYWETRTVAITKMNGNNGHVILAEVANNDNDSGLIYDLGTTKVFDGNGNRGSLYERDPSTLVQTLTTGWREGFSGSYVTIQRLVCNEFLSLMNAPIQRYQGGVFSAHDFSDRLVFDSKNWLQLGGRFSANDDTWDGEWFAISKETIAITNVDTGTVGDPVFSVGTNSLDGRTSFGAIDTTNLDAVDATVSNDLDVSGNTDLSGTLNVTNDVYFNGALEVVNDVTFESNVQVDGNSNLSGTLNVSNTISAGGDITTTSDISGRDVTAANNADVGGTLDVEGATTLATTSVGEFTTTGRVNVTINDIVGSPGGSETLSLSNNVNFISWETGEGNGTYTLNLPSSQSGVIMRFKTDDTIEANKTIRLLPQSGEVIDGEGAYTMDRSFDGITLMGHNSNWFVIQKKEK